MEEQHQKVGSRIVGLAQAKLIKPKKIKVANDNLATNPADCSLGEPTPHHDKLWHHLRLAPIGLIILAVIATAWIGTGSFLIKAKVGSNLIKLHTSDASLQQSISTQVQAYKLTLATPNGQQSKYSLYQMGLSLNTKATLAAIRQQQDKLSQRLIWWKPVNVPLVFSNDNKALTAFIVRSATVTLQPAVDANLSINGSGAVELSAESAGKQYGLTNPSSTILSAVASLSSTPLHLQMLTLRPSITSQELANSKTKLEQIISQPVSFNVGDKTVQPSASDIATWIEISPDTSNKTVNITVDSGKVSNYIKNLVAADTHPPRDQVVVTHPDGTTAVLVAGENGVKVANQQSAATDVASNLMGVKASTETLSVTYAPFQTVSTLPYDKWIEVDTTNKRMYAYEQTTLVKTFLVSSGAPATPTPIGQFKIYAKYVSQNMTGLNVDGSTYFQPNVPWVNYFTGGDAIHGNYWRPLSYFGNINSSHGCVGVVPGDGEWIYNWAPIGTPVITHT